MKNYCRPSLLVLCSIITLILFLPGKLFAQALPKLIFEKVYLHTDRNVYYPSDTLWFKAYLINAQDDQLISSSNNLYVDLISADNRLIRSALVRLDKGTGHGDFELPDSVAGTFRLRVYTNWMRNFGDNFLFEKEITIVNDQTNVAGAKFRAGSAIPIPQNTLPTKLVSGSSVAPALSFYPEGGSMLEGAPSLVAINARNSQGEGIPASGTILTAKGDTVTNFKCDSLGMGLFNFIPLSGEHYFGTIDGSKSSRYDIPPALKQGLGIHLRYLDTSILIQILSINAPVDQNGVKNSTVIIRHAGKILSSYRITLQDGQAIFSLSRKNLPTGVNSITVYDAHNKPQCERLVFVQAAAQLKPAINIAQAVDATGKVTVQIDAGQAAQLSVAVTDADLGGKDQGDIVSYFQLQSELRGKIRMPGRYFDPLNVNRFKQLDLLLMVQGWRDFVWRRIADTSIRISYPVETGITIGGKTYDERTNKPISNANISLFAPGAKSNRLMGIQADSLGRFLFPELVLYGKQNVKLTSVDNKGEKKGTFLIDTIASLSAISTKTKTATVAASPAPDDLPKKENNLQNHRFLTSKHLKEVKIKGSKTLMTRSSSMLTQWGPIQSFIIKPEDEQYKTVEWFVLQNFKGAMQSRIDDNGFTPTGVEFPGLDTVKVVTIAVDHDVISYKSRSTLIPPMLYVNGEELYMEEEVQAEAYRQTYFYLPINKVKKIELKHFVGTLHSFNVPGAAESVMVDRYILYLTVDEDALIYNPGRKTLDIRGYDEERVFYQPSNSAGAEAVGYRPTLLWLPDVKTDASGKASFNFFQTNNNPNLKVYVQGVSESGVPVFVTGIYSRPGH